MPLAEARKIAAAIKNHELFELEGADHTFSGMVALLELAPRVTAFLSEGL